MKSRVVKEEVTCSNCHQKYMAAEYPMLNITEFPKLRPRVMDTSLFAPRCPHCGKRNIVRYSITYNDQKKNLIFCMYLSESEYREALQMRQDQGIYGQLMQYVNQKGEVRIMRTPIELAEKVCIAQSHLDDRMMELMKYHMLAVLREKQSLSGTLYYLLHSGKPYLLLESPEGKLSGLSYIPNAYQEAVRTYHDVISSLKNKPVVVNQAWAEKIVHPVNFREENEPIGFE